MVIKGQVNSFDTPAMEPVEQYATIFLSLIRLPLFRNTKNISKLSRPAHRNTDSLNIMGIMLKTNIIQKISEEIFIIPNINDLIKETSKVYTQGDVNC